MRHDELDDEPYLVIEKRSGSAGSFLVGLAIGAGVALLFAPQSGLETRRAVSGRARDARDRARSELGRRVADARDAVGERVDRARQAVEMRRRQVERAVEAGRAAAVEARADLERRIAETKAAYQAGTRAARDARTSIRTQAPGIASAGSATILDATGTPLPPSAGGSADSGGDSGGTTGV